MRIVCIHGHPDDAEILAGGTVALLPESGHSITIVSMTPGDCGSTVHGAEEIAAIRRKEAAQSASLIGAGYVCAEFRDMAIFNTDDARRRVTELIRKARPDIVPPAPPGHSPSDHEPTTLLATPPPCSASPPH